MKTSNVVTLQPRRSDKQKYRAALARQQGVKPARHWSDDRRQQWLGELAGNRQLSPAAVRAGVIIQMMEHAGAGWSWPAIQMALRGLRYPPPVLDRAVDELIAAGLLGPRTSTATAR